MYMYTYTQLHVHVHNQTHYYACAHGIMIHCNEYITYSQSHQTVYKYTIAPLII